MPLSNPGPASGDIWRLVEAQHRISTMKLVDTIAEQAALERLLEASKPPVPVECQHLHYLLFTPFRYQAHHGSRFRRPGHTLGVYYASETPDTAVAEVAFWRLLFFLESPGTPKPVNALEMTSFSVPYKTQQCADLTRKPYTKDAGKWTDPLDYSACHALADTLSQQDGEAIRSVSVRDPAKGHNIALLTCAAFAADQPKTIRTWRLQLTATGALALCDTPRKSLQFALSDFNDPRLLDLLLGTD